MDERIFRPKIGRPIPKWDLDHRLSITEPVGPICKEEMTTYRVNSTFMDVSDQPNSTRQWSGGGGFHCFLGVLFAVWMFYIMNFIPKKSTISFEQHFIGTILSCFVFVGFAYAAVKYAGDEFFALKRRPIRFNRKTRMIYAIRHRRFGLRPGEGDITWQAPWNEESIFCIHKGNTLEGTTYHIRHYTVDTNGNVLRAFAIGREWIGETSLEGALAQWNYWCWFMNKGPAELPAPILYLSEHEDMRESFLYCMFDFGFQTAPTIRLSIMPVILLMTGYRLFAMWTCRDPVWPREVLMVSGIDENDPYDQPRGKTPVGWAVTILAPGGRRRDVMPLRRIDEWAGEQDEARNASLWGGDRAPLYNEWRHASTLEAKATKSMRGRARRRAQHFGIDTKSSTKVASSGKDGNTDTGPE